MNILSRIIYSIKEPDFWINEIPECPTVRFKASLMTPILMTISNSDEYWRPCSEINVILPTINVEELKNSIIRETCYGNFDNKTGNGGVAENICVEKFVDGAWIILSGRHY